MHTVKDHIFLEHFRITDEKFGSIYKIILNFLIEKAIQVFRNTMFGPEGRRPQHCCAWLGVASSFPECASVILPEEV